MTSKRSVKDRLRSAIYSLYFAVTSAPLLAELDWAIRRYLLAKAGLGSNTEQIALIQTLAKGRDDCLEAASQAGRTPPPSLDIIVYPAQLGAVADIGPTLACLAKTPNNGCSFHVWQIGPSNSEPNSRDKSSATNTPIDVNICQVSSLDIAASAGDAELVLVFADNIQPKREMIERALSDCVTDSADTAWWEYSPSLGERAQYIDPVTLRIPCSTGACIAFRREVLTTCAPDPDNKPSIWLLSLSIRCHENGWALVNRTRLPSSLYFCHPANHPHALPPLTPRAEKSWQPFTPLRLGSIEQPEGLPLPASDLPLVSVIIRTFSGRGNWLRESVQSALNQSYPKLELVIVEDGEPSHCSLIDKIRNNLADGQHLIYISREKQGKSKAGNLGLATAQGQYLMFLDDDDLLYPAHVELLIRHLLAAPTARAAYGLAVEVHTRYGNNAEPYEEVFYGIPHMMLRDYSQAKLEHDNLFPIQSVVFHRSLYDELGGFDPEKRYLEDWDLWLRYARRTTFTRIPVVTSLYRTPAEASERVARIRNPNRRGAPAVTQ